VEGRGPDDARGTETTVAGLAIGSDGRQELRKGKTGLCGSSARGTREGGGGV